MKEEEKEKIILKVVDKYYDIKKDYSARNRALMMVSEVLEELNISNQQITLLKEIKKEIEEAMAGDDVTVIYDKFKDFIQTLNKTIKNEIKK